MLGRRRLSLSATAIALALALPSAPPAQGAPAARRGRPNVVVILADDLGFSDAAPYGGEIATPNLDRLARNGIRYTQFYNTSRCCPTRASLLTGLYSHRAGIGHMVQDRGTPAYRGRLDDRAVTLAEALKAADYQTLMVGKWHVGSQPEHWPRRRGFDRFYGLPLGGGVYFKQNFVTRPDQKLVSDDTPVTPPDGWYVTEALTDQALAMLDEAAARPAPFFLYFAHVAPHFPLQARAADIARYRERYGTGWDVLRPARQAAQIRIGLVSPSWPLAALDGVAAWQALEAGARADLALRMAVYAAMVDALDQSVGRVVAKLEALGRLEDTLVFFLSDNGASAEGGPGGFDRVAGAPADRPGAYPSYGQGWAQLSNTPFRRWKSNVHEGGIATPLIVHWPRGIDPRAHGGAWRRQVGHVIDIVPTVLDVTGARLPRSRAGTPAIAPLDGQSLRPSFTRDQARPRTLFWEHEGHRAVRRGDLKLVALRDKPWELYDLARDRTESDDLTKRPPAAPRPRAAGAAAGTARSLEDLWSRWAKEVGVLPWPPGRKPGG
jgi:arylsulfatase